MLKAKFINKEKVIQRLSKLAVKARGKDKNIKKILLFGSMANDTYTALSDADLLIILKESKLRFIDRIPNLSPYFINAPVPVDIFPYTEQEVEKISFAKSAIKKGIELG